jgi:hypothetical protein
VGFTVRRMMMAVPVVAVVLGVVRLCQRRADCLSPVAYHARAEASRRADERMWAQRSLLITANLSQADAEENARLTPRGAGSGFGACGDGRPTRGSLAQSRYRVGRTRTGWNVAPPIGKRRLVAGGGRSPVLEHPHQPVRREMGFRIAEEDQAPTRWKNQRNLGIPLIEPLLLEDEVFADPSGVPISTACSTPAGASTRPVIETRFNLG